MKPVDPTRHPRRVSHPEQSLGGRLTRLSLLEPVQRDVGLRPTRWSLLAVPLLGIGLVLAVREVARVERVLAAEGSRAQRVIVYEVRPGAELRVPIERGTEVFRIVVHAMRRGPLLAAPHPARLQLSARTDRGDRTEVVELLPPGAATRVTPEDDRLVVGDPAAVSFDVHGLGTGELQLTLLSVVDADALLVRVYRREVVGAERIADRPERLGPDGRARLAHLAGEIDWNELDPDEQASLLSERWRRVAALPHSNRALVTHALALSGPAALARPIAPDPALAAWEVRGDERIALMVRGRNALRARSEGDPEAKVVAVVRHLDGRVDVIEGKGEVRVDVPLDYQVGVELWRSTPGFLSIRADDPRRLEPSTHVAAYRARRTRPVVIDAAEAPLLVRVAARRAVPRTAGETFSIALDATISRSGAAQASTSDAAIERRALRATRPRSLYDRYDLRTPDAAPTQGAVFHLLVPAFGRLTLAPVDEPLDLSLSELDPQASPKPVAAYAADKPWPRVAKTGEPTWDGWVSRSPSNAQAFSGSGRVVLRIARRLTEVNEPEPKTPTFRVRRPDGAGSLVRSNRVFDPTVVSFELDVPADGPLVLPVRLFATEPMDVVARIDGGAPRRIALGAAERVTTERVYAVESEVRTVMVVGDDLPRGRHVLTFAAPAGKVAWVHLPWTAKPRGPGAAPRDPHWIDGDLED